MAAAILFIIIFLLAAGAKSHQQPPQSSSSSSCYIPAIYNFGDSNSDTGSIAVAFQQPMGRACDGRLIIDFFAEKLGLPYLTAYQDSLKDNYTHGVNFATGGATIRRVDESWYTNWDNPLSLDIQVEHFSQFKDKTTNLYNQAKDEAERSNLPRPEDFAKAIYTTDIGQNDIAYGFKKAGVDGTRAMIPDIVNQFAASIQKLYGKGARAFWVHNTGPIGCLPVTYVKVHDAVPGYQDEIGCVKDQNGVASEFNNQLKSKIVELKSTLKEATITYVDMYSAKYELIRTAKEQGFEDRFMICCGYHDSNADVYCGNKGTFEGKEVFAGPCKDPSKVISWDGVHYSEAANRWVAARLISGSYSDPPISITQACPN